ncbi:MAG: peptidoglycan-binding protein [Coleofasciculaceae cyanobacterium SM2_3_26]|nr:peptidoglycan-binding protein [Coleofasciculaceae cyanobacterium SM2_3_26]
MLREGNEGAEVAALQDSLRRLGYFNGKITKYFGASTKAAVERFQRDYLLEADGVFGLNTRNTLERVLAGQSTPVASATVPGAIAYNPVTYAPGGSTADFTTSASPTFAASPVLREGDRGTDVAYLQELLEVLGYFRGERTGYFGASTKAAVENLQQDNFLPVDAVVGSQTWSVLRSTLVAR